MSVWAKAGYGVISYCTEPRTEHIHEGIVMKTTGFRGYCLSVAFLIVLGVLAGIFTAGDACAYYPATYGESAHGDLVSGVNRSTATCENWPGGACETGSCAHCHDTFDPYLCGTDPNGLMLFAPNNPTSQTDNFCFQCHKGTGSVQVGGLTNNDYGSEFGGGVANFTNIQDAFASGYNGGAPEEGGSSHNLLKMRNWARWYPQGDWITGSTNACLVCHPQHLAQKNHDPYPASPPYKTAVRRTDDPSTGRGIPGNLWGDELGSDAGPEIIDEWASGHYQAPFWKDSTSTFEPANQSDPSDGSNLPNFAQFCYTCHVVGISDEYTDANIPPREIAGDDYGLWAVKWMGSDGSTDQHGAYWDAGTSGEGDVKAPYTSGYNHGLSCLDCHEPHGSPNPFLLRTCVNGKDGITVSIAAGESDWGHLALYDFCTACHEVYTSNTNPAANFYHSFFTTEQAPTLNCTHNGGCHGHAGAF